MQSVENARQRVDLTVFIAWRYVYSIMNVLAGVETRKVTLGENHCLWVKIIDEHKI